MAVTQDAGSQTLFLLTVLIVTMVVILAKFAFFNYSYYYQVKSMIFGVMKSMSHQDYDDAATIQDFDTYVVNLSKYLETNDNANKRLDVLNEESGNYIDFHNYICVYKFFIVAGLVAAAMMGIIYVKYWGGYLSNFVFVGVNAHPLPKSLSSG